MVVLLVVGFVQWSNWCGGECDVKANGVALSPVWWVGGLQFTAIDEAAYPAELSVIGRRQMRPNPRRGRSNLSVQSGTEREEALALATMVDASGSKPVNKARGEGSGVRRR